MTVDNLFFIGAQLVALSPTGRIGVWNSLAQHWQSQELAPITAHDTAGSFLLLGSSNGSINYIDMQKFPLRMKDNDLLVTELYRYVGYALCFLFMPCYCLLLPTFIELMVNLRIEN